MRLNQSSRDKQFIQRKTKYRYSYWVCLFSESLREFRVISPKVYATVKPVYSKQHSWLAPPFCVIVGGWRKQWTGEKSTDSYVQSTDTISVNFRNWLRC